MKRITVLSLVTAGLIAITAAGAAAQDPPVSRLLPDMVSLAATVARGDSGDHRDHFVQGLVDVPAIHDLNRAIMFQAGGFSLGPSSLVVTMRDGRPEQRLVGRRREDRLGPTLPPAKGRKSSRRRRPRCRPPGWHGTKA